jgi:hypothetical protein
METFIVELKIARAYLGKLAPSTEIVGAQAFPDPDAQYLCPRKAIKKKLPRRGGWFLPLPVS